jgi:hypothetical protein
MTEPAGPDVARLLAALERLPTFRGLAFRGVPTDVDLPGRAVVTSLLTATSRNPRVGSENFAHRRLIAIASRKGRDIGMLAANPAEAEIVFLPGTTLLPLKEVRVVEADVTVLLVEELDLSGRVPPDNRGMPASLAEFEARAVEVVAEAFHVRPMALTSPGKFAGPVE